MIHGFHPALQSLKEFYEDQRGRYQSPTELEMRVYHRLIHIRDQRERHEDIPDFITSHPVFKLTTTFRLHVQRKSAPISRNSPLVIDAESMQIFAQLAGVLREQGNVVMIYLVSFEGVEEADVEEAENMLTDDEEQLIESVGTSSATLVGESVVAQPSFSNLKPVQPFLVEDLHAATPKATVKSAFSNIASSESTFGTTNVFGGAAFGATTTPRTTQTTSAFASVFGGVKKAPVAVSPNMLLVWVVFETAIGNAPGIHEVT